MTKKNALILSAVILIAGILSLAVFLKVSLRPKETRVKAVIVIDDWGYNLRCLKPLREIKASITISILPNLRYSSKIAEKAKGLGQEIILHLPLEPETKGRKYIGLEKNTIKAEMPEEKVIAILRGALDSVPYAIGVSNHMGSRTTKDERLMAVIFTELKKRKLFFLDNLVIEESICKPLAARMGLKFAQRDFFLDNKNDIEYIKGQLEKFSEFVRKSGSAVAIAHARPLTLKVLKEQIPLMQAQGIEFVPISELVE